MSNELKHIPWPGWEMVREIGKGTFGTVYEIKHDLITEEERAALKVLSVPQNESEIKSMRSEGMAVDEITQTVKEQAGRILQEYKSLCDLQGAPNIVRCNAVHHEMHKEGVGVDVYILMELLIPLLDNADELLQTEAQIVGFAIDMCHALIACEDKKILHRDIKPENIFVSKEGVYKLGDFGVARSHDHTTYGTRGIGTPSYMAPEVANGGEYNKQADIYSLGIVLYWLLNKRRTPFLPLPPKGIRVSDREEALKRRCSGEPIPAPVNGSKELKRIVLKACAFDLKNRYLSAADLLADLNVLAGVQPAVVPLVLDMREGESATNMDSVGEEETCGPVFDKATVKGNVEETVGPVFAPVSTDETVDQEETVGPVFVTTELPKQPKKKKKVWPIIAASLLIVVIMILFWPVYGEWSEWSTTEPEKIKGRKIETVDEYRYQERVLLSTTNMEDVVGEVDHEEMGYGAWGEWDEWQTLSIESDEATEVEEQTQYRSREKEYTTSNQASMTGWIQYDSSSSSYWSAWSDWSPDAVTASETREVETATQYRSSDRILIPDSTDPSLASQGYDVWERWVDSDGVTHYYYCGWSAWSAWTFEAMEPSDPRAVQTRTVYQHRDYITDVTYSYWKWGDWTEWSFDPIEGDANTDVENRQVYRSRKATEVPLYYYYDWSDWSDWSFEKIEKDEEKSIETRPTYRYVDKHYLWEKLLEKVQ